MVHSFLLELQCVLQTVLQQQYLFIQWGDFFLQVDSIITHLLFRLELRTLHFINVLFIMFSPYMHNFIKLSLECVFLLQTTLVVLLLNVLL